MESFDSILRYEMPGRKNDLEFVAKVQGNRMVGAFWRYGKKIYSFWEVPGAIGFYGNEKPAILKACHKMLVDLERRFPPCQYDTVASFADLFDEYFDLF